MVAFDQTLVAALKGYAWLPDLRRKYHGRPFALRFAGRPAVAISDLLVDDGVDTLAKHAGEAFDDASERWRAERSVTLFDEAAGVIADAVTRWTGVREMVPAADLVAMVDGFASAGPRQLRARQARRRQAAVLSRLIEDVRREEQSTTPVSRIAHHREDGRLLDPHTAAVGVRARAAALLPVCPFVAGIATRDLRFHGFEIPRGTLVLLDIYGQHHDPRVWARPYEFRPERTTTCRRRTRASR